MEKYFTTEQVAKILQVHRFTILKFIKKGKLKGIQLGGIGSMAPERRKDLSNLAFKAMIGGALASWLTATIAGILI